MGKVADFVSTKTKKNPKLRLGSLLEISNLQKREPLQSGNVVFDYVTSIGGIPRGVVTEMRGFNSSGKSTLAAQVAAQHQKAVKAGEATGAILYLDFEYAVSAEYFSALGLDIDDPETFIYYQPDTLEEGFNMFLDMTKEGLLALCVVDSVAGASAEAEYEATIGKMSIGLKARALSQALRMCVGPMKTNGTSLILINHTQQKIATTFGEKQAAARGIVDTVSPGGKAMEFYPSLRIEFARPTNVKSEAADALTNDKTKQVTSTEVVVTAFKNKVGTPHRSGKMRVEFGKGFNPTYSATHVLIDHGIIKKKPGGHFVFPPELLKSPTFSVPVGEDNLIRAISNDPPTRDLIHELARKLVVLNQVEQSDSSVDVSEADEMIDLETGEVYE